MRPFQVALVAAVTGSDDVESAVDDHKAEVLRPPCCCWPALRLPPAACRSLAACMMSPSVPRPSVLHAFCVAAPQRPFVSLKQPQLLAEEAQPAHGTVFVVRGS